MEEPVSRQKLPVISGVTCDSRQVKPGYAFVSRQMVIDILPRRFKKGPVLFLQKK